MENKGMFKKGNKSWNKGLKGYSLTENHKKRISESLKGHVVSEETKEKIRKKNTNQKRTQEFREKASKNNLGKKLSEETKRRMSISRKGIKHNKFPESYKPWNYIDGRSKLLAPARYGDDWDKIRYLIYIRDKFTCQDCGILNKRLDVHHIISFMISFDNSLNNLVSLCRGCHMKREQNLIKKIKIGEISRGI